MVSVKLNYDKEKNSGMIRFSFNNNDFLKSLSPELKILLIYFNKEHFLTFVHNDKLLIKVKLNKFDNDEYEPIKGESFIIESYIIDRERNTITGTLQLIDEKRYNIDGLLSLFDSHGTETYEFARTNNFKTFKEQFINLSVDRSYDSNELYRIYENIPQPKSYGSLSLFKVQIHSDGLLHIYFENNDEISFYLRPLTQWEPLDKTVNGIFIHNVFDDSIVVSSIRKSKSHALIIVHDILTEYSKKYNSAYRMQSELTRQMEHLYNIDYGETVKVIESFLKEPIFSDRIKSIIRLCIEILKIES